MVKITIIDYGSGNLFSIKNALEYLGYHPEITDSPKKIAKSKICILPGVGAFDASMKIIKKKKIFESVCEVNDKKNKILGICLGMQLLCQSSTENVFSKGFSFVNLKVDKFKKKKNFKYPHVGFNNISNNKNMRILKYLPSNPDFYFDHSLRTSITNKLDVETSITNYGENFVSCFERDNIFGTQFHPEKSKTNGLKLLSNFVKC